MTRINIKSKTGSYPVIIGSGILPKADYFFKKAGITGKCILICSRRLYRLYGKTLTHSISNETETIITTDGEESKSLGTVQKLYDKLINLNVNRDITIIALGGGVTGDLAGYVAATYLRGVNLVHIPTSLIAQADSSIGGKVGINYKNIKNMIGSFHPPKLVLTDIKVLRTLPETEFNNGMAEIIKSAIIKDKKLFHFLRTNHKQIKKQEQNILLRLITKTCKIKISIIEQDETEKKIRKILNFGHTFGHPIEMLYRYKHGEAIAIGMMMATKVAEELNILKDKSFQKQLESLLKVFNLPTDHPPLSKEYWNLLLKDKKRREKMVFILPKKIGKVKIVKSDIGRVKEIMENLK